MENVNISYINTYHLPEWPWVRGSVFAWIVIAACVLDLILILWIVNPFAKPAIHERSALLGGVANDAQYSKPSPLGSVIPKRRAPAKAQLKAAKASSSSSIS